MFNMFIDVPTRTSDAIEWLQVDLLKQQVRCAFVNGGVYHYKNVSKRAIANVLFNPDISLGFWINNNCVNADRARLWFQYNKDGYKFFNEPQLPAFV